MAFLQEFVQEVASAVFEQNGNQLSWLLRYSSSYQDRPDYSRLIDAIPAGRDIPLSLWYQSIPDGFADEDDERFTTLWPSLIQKFFRIPAIYQDVEPGSALAKETFAGWLAVCQTFLRIFQSEERWILPVLYQFVDELWRAAEAAEDAASLEETARLVNKAFTICITDRNPSMEDCRKWGTYKMAGKLFMIYFHLGQLNLCNNILRAIGASILPELEEFPAAHRVTYRYYLGRFHFVNERYNQAEEELSAAFYECHKESAKGKRQILSFLIPTRLLVHGKFPKPALLQRYSMSHFYSDAFKYLRTGNVTAYHALLDKFEHELLELGTFLIWERLILIGYRMLVRLVSRLEGSTRIPLDKICVAFGRGMDLEEAGCILAGLIDVGLVRGYISQEKATLVVSAKDPFVPISSCKLVK